MKKQIALNVFFYLGIILSIIGLKWAMKNENHAALALFIVTGAFFIYLKIRLIRDLRRSIKDKTM
ncbi:DUF6358 family protein [Pedobacter duraquae]|uniref:Uncharacterized protein n=1 Tax=Pedobacter duraquae TaxID=425511 RepID=A0A4R6IHF6_9SPHI|nr:DUF6358 family protein [Pedobacter duraquae]TDO21371.1 hypothetical protein CLV32_2476 [Pedobacter duraquae]